MSKCPHIDLVDPANYLGGIRFDWLRELRRHHPVYWHDDPGSTHGGFWAVTRREHIDFVSKRPDLFSSHARGCLMNEPPAEWLPFIRTQFLNLDPPVHTEIRRLAGAALTPARVRSYEPRLREVMRGILDRVAPRGECEFVGEVAAELPLIAICEVLGIPIADRHDFFRWGDTIIESSDPDNLLPPDQILGALTSIFAYAKRLFGAEHDGRRSFALQTLADGRVTGRPLTEEELCNTFMMLVVGGNETTRTMIAHGMRLLIEHPAELAKVRADPSLVPDAVEEFLRYHTSVSNFARTATRDVELGGAVVQAGHKVVMFYHSAGRDEDAFADPDVFDVARNRREDVKNGHRAFGSGQHFCLGAHLARAELRIAFEAIVARLRNPRFAEPPVWVRSNFVNGIKSMRVRFEPEDAVTRSVEKIEHVGGEPEMREPARRSDVAAE